MPIYGYTPMDKLWCGSMWEALMELAGEVPAVVHGSVRDSACNWLVMPCVECICNMSLAGTWIRLGSCTGVSGWPMSLVGEAEVGSQRCPP